MDKVAFVIVGWNNHDLLTECIESIKDQTYKDTQIIYVDNNSSDKSVELVKRKFPEVDVIKLDENTGFAKGNNIGIKRALENKEVRYIALLNTDATLSEDWTDTIVKFANLKPKGAAFQTVTLDYYDHNIIDSTHIFIAHSGLATQGSWRRAMLHGVDPPPQKVFGCNAAAVIYSRKFIETQPFNELFDERLFMYLEDVDVAARATVMGWDNYVVPGSRAYHMGSASSGKNPGYSLYMTFRNNTAVLIKNLPLIILIRMFPKLVRGDIDTMRTLARTGRKPIIKKVLWGRLVGISRAPLYLLKRYKIYRVRNTGYKFIWSLMYKGF